MDAADLKDEIAKLDALRLAHERTSARVEYLETNLMDHRAQVSKTLSDLQDKVDALHARFDSVTQEVRALATRVSIFAIAAGITVQVVLRHFGLL